VTNQLADNNTANSKRNASGTTSTATGPNDPSDPAFGVESMVDIEIPDKKVVASPPPAPQWQPRKNSLSNFDLSGTWQAQVGSHVERISVFQLRDLILIYNLDGRPLFLSQGLLMVAQYSASGIAKGHLVIVDRTESCG
jgi:hypothetical protein